MQGKSHSVLGRTRVQDIGPDKLLPPNDDAYHDLGTTMTRETPVATSGERKLLMDYLLSSDVGTCMDCGIIVRVWASLFYIRTRRRSSSQGSSIYLPK